MDTNKPKPELKGIKELLESYSKANEALKMINKAYNKQKQQVEEMYAFFNELLNILSKVDAKSNKEAQDLTWAIRTALMTSMLKIKFIGEQE